MHWNILLSSIQHCILHIVYSPCYIEWKEFHFWYTLCTLYIALIRYRMCFVLAFLGSVYCCILVLYGVLVHLGSVPCVSFDSCYSKCIHSFLFIPLCCSIHKYSLIRPPYVRSINRVYWGTHAFDDEFFFKYEPGQVCAISNSNQTTDEMEFLFLNFFFRFSLIHFRHSFFQSCH